MDEQQMLERMYDARHTAVAEAIATSSGRTWAAMSMSDEEGYYEVARAVIRALEAVRQPHAEVATTRCGDCGLTVADATVDDALVRSAALRPLGCMNRIIEDDGHWSCWHDDSSPCDREGHETIETYWIDSA